MANILTSDQMRDAERSAIDAGKVSAIELMERAGAAVVDAILTTWPALEHGTRRAAVFCGPGNNGGDGFVVARLLHLRGWQVDVALLPGAGPLPPDAQTNCRRWQKLGPVRDAPDARADGAAWPDVAIDALFGIGLTRPLGGAAQDWARATHTATPPGARIVAIDIPSGLCADTGRVIGATAVRADLTVTFHRAKHGHLRCDGPAHCGRLVIADIGL